uniref:PGG domain-containing protein n=1 Tax=Oryza glaberrima TaxID=4538 RepID=I1Q130_ORYGL
MAGRHTSHTMEHKLLKAVATGDADLLAQALGIWPTATAEQGDVDQSCCLKGVTAEGSSVLHIAASRGHLKLVVMICTHDISLIKLRNNQLDTPLICAARAGHVDVVDYLVRAASAMQEPERSVLRAWNSGGATAMHEAVRNGYAPVLQKLMSSDSGLATMVDDKGMSPLYLVASKLRGARWKNRVARCGQHRRGSQLPPSFSARTLFKLLNEMSESLRRWEPTLAEKVDIDGRTALHYAVLTGETGLVELLLDNSSAAYIPDNDGLFPVHVAAIAGKASVTRMLMEMCLNCDELLDNKQRNVLHCAVEYGRLMVVWYICRNPKFTRLLNAGDCEGNTPLHLAVKHGNAIIISCLMMNTRVNLSIINHGGSTPLDVAFNKSTRDYSLSWLSSTSITMCLQACNAYTSRFLNRADKRFLEDKEESSVYTNVSQSILCISVLIAAGSFAAAFTPPGGYIADGEDAGMPLLKEYAEFSSYVAANSMSFYCSTFATCLLVHDSLTNRRRRRYLSLSAGLVFL